MSDMGDLKREVQRRLHDTLDGKEIDMEEGIHPRLPHMLGVTSLNSIYSHHAKKGTLLDCNHEFWQNYDEDIRTDSGAEKKLQTAVRLLKEDGAFRMAYPHGEEAGIIYCEIDPIPEQNEDFVLETACKDCGTTIHTTPILNQDSGYYDLRLSLDCPSCDFSAVLNSHLREL